jgi:NADPH-dependent 2,4-dienoyl-CoA reductase/sulfur reductase-like enzyme
VAVVDAATTPLERVLGRDVGGILARRYRRQGVDVRLGRHVTRIAGGEHVREVELDDGTLLRADLVVVGIGAVPVSPFGGAVDVDEHGRSAVPGVYACGDVASWWRPSLGRRLRVEHWTSAAGQARAVAASIAADPVPYDDPPYFWSDQFGLRLQHVGHAERWHAVVLEGDEDAFTARYVDRDGRTLAALAANRSQAVAELRRELAA